MTKAELIERIIKSRALPDEVSKKCIEQVLNAAFDELGAYFARARLTKSQSPRFTYPGFGTFTKKKRSARKGVNPRTLEPMQIDASFTIDFRPGVELRSALNGLVKEPVKDLIKEAAKEAAKEPTRSRLAVVEAEDAVEAATPRRRLRSRDEVEIEELDDDYDPSLFAADPLDLPQPPMQRVPGRRASKKNVGS
ncbi:MAG: HU family DNA-binding protein [Nannocystaceae bacterium]